MSATSLLQLPKNPHGVETPLRYPGGKSALSGLLIALLKRNSSIKRYVEPFAGGAGAALNLLYNGYVNEIVINDYDPAIYCFWQSVTQNNELFLETLDNTEITIEEWFKQREIYRKCDPKDVFNLGFATFFLNRCNRSGIIKGGVIGGQKQTGAYKLDARFNPLKLKEKIKKIGNYSSQIKVLNEDGKAVFNQYKDKLDTFLYLDPPYVKQGTSLYLNAFSTEDHISLSDAIKSAKKESYWLVTYDCSDLIASQKCYGNCNIYRYSLRYSAQKKRREYEYLICSDSIKNQIESFLD